MTVIDADGHVLEPRGMWQQYLDRQLADLILVPEPKTGRRVLPAEHSPQAKRPHPISGTVAGLTGLAGSVGKPADDVLRGKITFEDGPAGAFDGHARLADMDLEGIDVAVLYPTIGLSIGNAPPGIAEGLCRAYNDWLRDYCAAAPARLIGIGAVPMTDVDAAAAEARRCVRELGFRGVFIRPNPYGGRHFDDPWYEPFWKAAAELGVPVGFHPLAMWDMPGATLGFDFPDISYAAAAGFAIDSMVTLTRLLFSGVLERFRDLQVIVLESSGGWIYSWLERLEHHMRLLPSLRPGVKRGALEQFHDQVWVSFDPDEKTLPAMVGLLGDDRFVWASDYPALRRDLPRRDARDPRGDRAAAGGEPAEDPGRKRAAALRDPTMTGRRREAELREHRIRHLQATAELAREVHDQHREGPRVLLREPADAGV
jgi:predicted TIM-barrel fold metal-dependent hydrolase